MWCNVCAETFTVLAGINDALKDGLLTWRLHFVFPETVAPSDRRCVKLRSAI